MKRIFLSLLCAIGISTAAFASSGDMALGVQLSHGSKINNMGLGVVFQCELVDAFRLEPFFNYYFEQSNVTNWNTGVNFHYVVPITNKFDIYPLVGVGYSNWKHDAWDDSQDRIILNVGGGADFNLSNRVALTGQLRYQFMQDYGQLATSLGVKVRF